MIRPQLAAAASLLVAGCAGTQTSYPSLAPRTAELVGFGEPSRPTTSAVREPALDAQLAALEARLVQIGNGFTAAGGDAERKADLARGRPAGSDPWLEAQTALAGLDDWRAQASALTTDIEQLAIARAATLAAPYPALAALGDRADAEARREGDAIARLQAMLAPA